MSTACSERFSFLRRAGRLLCDLGGINNHSLVVEWGEDVIGDFPHLLEKYQERERGVADQERNQVAFQAAWLPL
jgi:hypothetical protein